ncbi:hypothetical protein LP416_17580 [Polaromonas sp. P2-4]|nr:hypothetical protein LP416_17580 [Polaromonas sp. P2-4]
MANATVSISCASGSGTTTTAANGSYTKDLTSITLPCALRAASSDGTTVLYSVTTATATSSSTQVANITPLTQLLVASLAGTDPATFFTNLSASTASSVTASSVSAAQAAVLTTLSNAGLDVSSLPDLLTGTLVAATSTTSGNAYDTVLDTLQTQLTNSGTTLATLTTAVAAASPTATTTTTTTTNVASLPASQLLKVADSNCAALRSGDYWAITPTMGGTIASQFTSGSYNAGTKTATNLAGASTVFSGNGNCNYLAGDGVSNIVVSQAGVVMARYQDGSNVSRLGFAIPKQTIALSELAGTWNGLGFERNDAGTSYAASSFTATISSTGVVSDVTSCNGASTSSICSAETPTINISSNSAGGFDMASTAVGDVWTDRAFAYRAGNGDLMVVQVAGDGSVSTWTKKRTLSPPAVGTNQGGSWSVRTLRTLVANALSTDTNTVTVTAVNSAADSFTRSANLANGTADYSETILLNTPRVGYNFRAAGSTTSTFDGRTVNLRERTNLGLRGMGVTVQSIPVQTGITSAGFQMTVDQP